MAHPRPLRREAPFFHLSQARWLVGVLSMLIAVVGKDSLLGLLLRQTRAEINGLLRDEEAGRPAAGKFCCENN
jgi:hypothetical protein